MRWPFLVPILATLLQMTAARAAVPLSKASTGHVTVPAMVDGQGPFDFVFDTGADESAVYAWFAKSLDLPKTKQRKVSGATGDAQMAGARLASLTVDGHTIRHVDADILPDRLDGVRFAGVVGVDLMLHRLAVLDFGCGTATLLPVPKTPGAEVGSGATLIKAGSIRDGKQLTLPVTVNGVLGVAVLDSGARVTSINRKFVVAAGLDPDSAVFREGDPTLGATMTPVSTRIGPIGTVVFAGITRSNVSAKVVDLPYLKGAGLAGVPAVNLGVDLLQGTRLRVDYAARRFRLAPSSCAASLSQ